MKSAVYIRIQFKYSFSKQVFLSFQTRKTYYSTNSETSEIFLKILQYKSVNENSEIFLSAVAPIVVNQPLIQTRSVYLPQLTGKLSNKPTIISLLLSSEHFIRKIHLHGEHFV